MKTEANLHELVTRLAGVLLVAVVLSGCATSRPHPQVAGHHFNFQTDTFDYPNELLWVYHYDEKGSWSTEPRVPKPTYSLHCFVVARSALQFFQNARFDPTQPVTDETAYRRLIRQVVTMNPRSPPPDERKIVIPGYANLRAFSEAHSRLLKAECGGAWQSYFQRGHWRMIFPFSRRQQQVQAEGLLNSLKQSEPVVVHLVRFPQLTINHAVVLFDAEETNESIQFAVYDPNQPERPARLDYDRRTRTFSFPANSYFLGGRVDVYRVYGNWNY